MQKAILVKCFIIKLLLFHTKEVNTTMSLLPDITPEQIDDWFKIGKKTAPIKGVKATTTGGRCLDPETLRPIEPERQHVPHYKRQQRYL